MSVLPPDGLSAIDSMAWLREHDCLVALGDPTEQRFLWRLQAFEPQTAENLREIWLRRGCFRYAFRLPREPLQHVVIDIDVNASKQWREMQRRFGIRNTRCVRTPGGGLHVYLLAPSAAKIRHGVDQLRDHGFEHCDVFTPNSTLITGPGSKRLETAKKPAGEYRWITKETEVAHMPQSLIDALAPKPVPEIELASRSDFSGEISNYARKALDGETNAVANCGAGGRQAQLYRSAARLGNLIGSGMLPEGLCKRELYAAAVSNELVKDDGAEAAKTTIRNGIKAGINTPREAPKNRPRLRGNAPGPNQRTSPPNSVTKRRTVQNENPSQKGGLVHTNRTKKEDRL